MEWVNEDALYTWEPDYLQELHVPRLMIQFSYRL